VPVILESQLLTIALATVPSIIVVMVGILLNNNNRLTDAKESMHAERVATRAELRAESVTTRELLHSQAASYQLDIISKIAELDNRTTRLER